MAKKEHIIVSDKTLLEQCQERYGRYGRYINKWRAFPLYEDGLKLVERRILYSEYLVARKKLTKSAEVVGFCMGKLHPHGDCLSGDTVIPLLNGTRITIKELAEKHKDEKFYVYSCDPKTGAVVPGLAHSPRVGQITDEMYCITLDNGEVVKCTKNHPFMTRWYRDKTYVKAQDLKVGMSLRPFYCVKKKDAHQFTTGEYEYVKSTYFSLKPTHRFVYEYFYGDVEKNFVVHHKDFNSLNNDPENLVKLTRSEHAKIHYNTQKCFTERANVGLQKGQHEMFDKDGKFRQKIFEKNSKLMTEVNHTLPLVKAIKLVQYLAQQQKDVNIQNYDLYRPSFGYNYPTIRKLIENGYIESFDDLVRKSEINHRIVDIKVVKLDQPIEFYDITVDKYENFAIEQGIFVHNSSLYGTLVQLCNCGLSNYNGNFGTKIGLHDEPPAAMRYTEVQMNQDVVDMAFQHLDFIPFESLELPTKEPIYLATKLPFCLIRGTDYCIGIGFGKDTYIPSYKPEDLISRLKWLLTKEGDEPIIKPVSDCTLKGTDEEFKTILTTGLGKINYCGKCKLDKQGKSVVINSICPTKQWSTVLNKFKDEIQVQKSIGYIDESCGDKTSVRFTVLKRGQNLEKIYKTISNLISGTVSFRCNMCDREGNVKIVSIDDMLLSAYGKYKEANVKMLESAIQKCQQIIEELKLVEKVKKVLPKWLKTFPDDIDSLIKGVHEDTKIELTVLKEMFDKYTIPRFTRCKTDTTEKQKQIDQLQNNLSNIDQFVWRLYQ